MRILVVVFLAIFAMSACAYAANESIATGMVDKAVNGAVNLLTGWVEVPMQVYKGFDKGLNDIKREGPSKVVGGVCGFFRGVIHGLGRTAWGAFELATFWAANPADNRGVGVPLDAKYSWEMGEQYCIDKPTLPEGCKPIGTKLINGVTDALLGIVEVPAQISKSVNDEKTNSNVFVGTLRGFWYWLSREVNGAANILSFLLPNPPENMGYAYNSKWPWTKQETKVK
jgi:putative exosortase-associated protein (TIGR04073 family)